MRRVAFRIVIIVLLLAPAAVQAQHVHPEPAATQTEASSPQQPPPSIPAVTDADRAAAFPDVGDHEVHGTSAHSLVMVDRFEWSSGTGRASGAFEATGWVGGDLDRVWFRTDADACGGRLDTSTAQLFYGRAVARWWDVVAGVRQDVGAGPSRTWAAVGIQGLAPYWFEVEATAYVGTAGRTHLHVSTEYELLVTNRLILQSAGSVDVFGQADRDEQVGAGLSTIEGALRLRYEIRRQFAPYAGIVWRRWTFSTADLMRAAGEPVGDMRVVIGSRLWF